MQIFGQVWLWSLGSFLLGVLFTWLLLVNPARKRVAQLEEAAARQPEPRESALPQRSPFASQPVSQSTRVAEPIVPPAGNETDRFLDDLFDTPNAPHAQPPFQAPPVTAQPDLTAPPELPPTSEEPAYQPRTFTSRLDPTAPPEPPLPDANDPLAAGPVPAGDDPAPGDADANETELSDSPFRQFAESTTVFVPPAGLRIPEKAEQSSAGEDWFAKEEIPDPDLITDVDDDERVDDGGTIFTQHTTPIPDEVIRSLDNTPEAQPEPAATQFFESRGTVPEAAAQPEPEPAEPVQPVQPEAVERTQRMDPAPAAPSDEGRSLFEPAVPVAEREETAEPGGFVPPGPFGPGSAMPLPGGGSPAPEFAVKASVTALRYCTQDNPQFDRIVAEVWFRTPGDAERVGFRVLS